MKIILVIIFSTICFSASAQWYLLSFKKHRPEAIEFTPDNSIARLPKITINQLNITPELLGPSEYSFKAVEAVVLKTAKHNMRFRVYNDASYNFSELARLYIQQNRYAEAKWFLLQSNSISRDESDDKHTIANLIDLATVKSGLGDYTLAQQDLDEAHNIANARGFKDDVTTIDKKMLLLKQNKVNMQKVDVRYAEAE